MRNVQKCFFQKELIWFLGASKFFEILEHVRARVRRGAEGREAGMPGEGVLGVTQLEG